MSRPELDFSTPVKSANPFEELNPRGSRKRKQIDFTSKLIKDNIDSQQASASPHFKKSKEMPACRSPNPNPIMKATLSLPGAPAASAMETDQNHPVVAAIPNRASGPNGTTAPVAVLGTAPALIDPEFLSKMDKKIDLLTAGMMSMSARVDEQGKKLGENSALIADQAQAIASNTSSIAEIFKRLEDLRGGDRGGVPPPAPAAPARAECSERYRWARRSIRLWPVKAGNEDELWEGVGDFLQDRLLLSSTQVTQESIEDIRKVDDAGTAGMVRDEVIVTLFSQEARDAILMSAKNLAGMVGPSGSPLAGVRLEIPPELEDTFRLLNRFGTRLRARHGEGTKRHIRFDDFNASLFAIVKLPGDTKWTRVTPRMARQDLDASFREEDMANQKRLAVKLLPGPRERLSRPLPAGDGRPPSTAALSTSASTSTSGQRHRPKWGAPASSKR